VALPFLDGESYEQVAERVGDWLRETVQKHSGSRILVIGHRATFFSFEHLIKGIPLGEVVDAPWQWQPGWEYEVRW
jgi:broad specificity phosphatase PhoE